MFISPYSNQGLGRSSGAPLGWSELEWTFCIGLLGFEVLREASEKLRSANHSLVPSSPMEIVRSNFAEKLPQIKEQISNCDFISIDWELTGPLFSNPPFLCERLVTLVSPPRAPPSMILSVSTLLFILLLLLFMFYAYGKASYIECIFFLSSFHSLKTFNLFLFASSSP